MPIFAVLIAILVGGGTSFAAQSAVPGDFLYPVKVGVNEKISGSVKFSDEAQADWEVHLAEVRLGEAQKLSAEGRLNAEVAAELEKGFKEHADRAEAKIHKFEEKNPDRALELASRFEASLAAHSAILGLVQGSAAANVDVESERDDAMQIRQTLESRISANASSTERGVAVKSAAEGKIGAAENVIAEVESFFERRAGAATSSATVSAEAELQAARDLEVQANAKLQAGDYANAFLLAGRALRTAQAAKVLLNATGSVGVETEATSTVSATTTANSPEREHEFKGSSTLQLKVKRGLDLDL